MIAKVRIVCLIMTMLFTIACSAVDDSVLTPVGTEIENEPTAVIKSLAPMVAQVETAVPTEPTPTNTPVSDAGDDEPEPTATETRRAFTVRTEVPTATPVVAAETPEVFNVLLVPTPRTYTVREGDTIKSIARFCEVTVADLLEENRIAVEDADKIVVGQVLRVPEGD